MLWIAALPSPSATLIFYAPAGGRAEGVVATGIIDEVRFYKQALTPAEVATLAGEK